MKKNRRRVSGLLVGLLGLLACACQAAPPTSFLVVSMDTFRADRVGAVDARGLPLTPSLDRLAQQSLVFTRAYAQANETLYSHASLFTGRYPSELGALSYERFRLPPDAATIAARLAWDGYRSEAVVAGGHMSAHFGLQAGFHRYQAMQDFSSFQQTVPAALERLELLAAGDDPFLLFVHGYDTHSPYLKAGPLHRLDAAGYQGPMLVHAQNPLTYERILYDRFYPDFVPTQVSDGRGNQFLSHESFDELEAHARERPEDGIPLSEADLDFLLGSYDAAVRHADLFVGLLLDNLEELGLHESTVVIVLADHGEDLLEHGHFNHRLSLHDENVHVPLLLRIPGVQPARIDVPVALADVGETIAALAGARARPGRGRSLLEPQADRAVYSESMRGDVSVRSAVGRLILPRDATQELSLQSEAPPRAWLGDDEGGELSWQDERRAELWRSLCETRL